MIFFSVAGRFTLDVVGKTLFGIHTDSAKDQEYGGNDFVETASRAFDDFTFSSLSMLVISKCSFAFLHSNSFRTNYRAFYY